jgi:hypothetical protein
MNNNIIYRKNKLFCIDKSKLKPQAQKDDVCLALYAAIYKEFSGAIYNKDYMYLTPIEKMNKINEYAYKWLDERGLL